MRLRVAVQFVGLSPLWQLGFVEDQLLQLFESPHSQQLYLWSSVGSFHDIEISNRMGGLVETL
jgi:hypothetical protein